MFDTTKPKKLLHSDVLEAILHRCVQVGDMQLQQQANAVSSKQDKTDGTPVTDIDKFSQEVLVHALENLTPGIPVLGEEQDAQTQRAAITSKSKIWTLDPLDGTKNYLNQSPEFSIHLALLSEPDETGKRTPLAGIIYVPATRQVFYTMGQDRAYRATLNNGSQTNIFATTPEPLKGPDRMPGVTKAGDAPEYLRIGVAKEVAEATEPAKQCHFFDAITNDPQINHVENRGMEVCAGKLDAAYCSHTLSMWDVAAIDAISRACGRMMLPIDIEKRRITMDAYDYRGTHYDGGDYRVPPYVVTTPELVPHIPHPPSLNRVKSGAEIG